MRQPRSAIGWILPLLGWAWLTSVPAPSAAADEEPVPRLGQPGDDEPLPDADAIERYATAYAPQERQLLNHARNFIVPGHMGGPPGSPPFDRKLAVAFGSLPVCGHDWNLRTFEQLRAIHAQEPAALEPQMNRCLLIAMVLERTREQTSQVRVAAAYGRLVGAWGRLLLGKDPDGPHVAEGIRTIVELAEGHPFPKASFAAFLGAIATADTGASELRELADHESVRLAKENPNDPAWVQASLARDLRAAIQLATREDKTAGPVLTALLTRLAPAAAVPPNDPELVGLYNHAVTAARRLKLPVKAPYRTREQRTSCGSLAFDVPLHTGWVQKATEGNQAVAWWVLSRGVTNETTLRIWKYSTSVDYVDDEGKTIGGDNVGGRAKSFYESDRATISKVRKASPSIGRLSKTIAATKGYELRGEDDVGIELWYREWYFKPSKAKDRVINVSLRRTGVALEDDPEIEFILESMREP